MPRLPDDVIAGLKAANPIDALIEARGVKLSCCNAKGIRAGQCLCAPARGKAPLWVDTGKNTFGCLKGGCGGDLFQFLEQFEGLDFAAALARLGGAEADPAALAQARERRAAAIEARRRVEAKEAEAERRKAWEIWSRGAPAPGTLVDDYFRWRGLDSLRIPSLRFSADEPYYEVIDTDTSPRLAHRGPCMLAAIQSPSGGFCGLHRTWLDPWLDPSCGHTPSPSGKAFITGADGSRLASKKMRGAKKGGAIRLADCPREMPGTHRVLLVGEGIETTATAWQALTDRPVYGTHYFAWAAGDLGNISGGTLGPATPHPSRSGLWVPSREPDRADPGLLPPAWATRTILLGDGDSDPHVTRARLDCGKARFEAAGCPTAIRMAPDGCDFNDLARGKVA